MSQTNEERSDEQEENGNNNFLEYRNLAEVPSEFLAGPQVTVQRSSNIKVGNTVNMNMTFTVEKIVLNKEDSKTITEGETNLRQTVKDIVESVVTETLPRNLANYSLPATKSKEKSFNIKNPNRDAQGPRISCVESSVNQSSSDDNDENDNRGAAASTKLHHDRAPQINMLSIHSETTKFPCAIESGLEIDRIVTSCNCLIDELINYFKELDLSTIKLPSHHKADIVDTDSNDQFRIDIITGDGIIKDMASMEMLKYSYNIDEPSIVYSLLITFNKLETSFEDFKVIKGATSQGDYDEFINSKINIEINSNEFNVDFFFTLLDENKLKGTFNIDFQKFGDYKVYIANQTFNEDQVKCINYLKDYIFHEYSLILMNMLKSVLGLAIETVIEGDHVSAHVLPKLVLLKKQNDFINDFTSNFNFMN